VLVNTPLSTGSGFVVDLRYFGPKWLAYLPNIHTAPIYDIQFLPINPNYMVTACADGSLASIDWHRDYDRWPQLCSSGSNVTSHQRNHFLSLPSKVQRYTQPNFNSGEIFSMHSIRFHPVSGLFLSATNQLNVSHL